MSPFQQKVCSKCGLYPATGSQLRRCGSCLAVKYCSSACQTQNWTSHKPVCKNVGAARKEELIPLMLAAQNGDVATVERLLKSGAKVDGDAFVEEVSLLCAYASGQIHQSHRRSRRAILVSGALAPRRCGSHPPR